MARKLAEVLGGVMLSLVLGMVMTWSLLRYLVLPEGALGESPSPAVHAR